MRKKTDNSDFILSADTVESVSLQVRMKGDITGRVGTDGVWAYNNPAYTSYQNELLKTREGNSVRVRMEQTGAFIVEKELANAPQSMQGKVFTFRLRLEGTEVINPQPGISQSYYSYQQYTLQNLVDGVWVSDTSSVYSTDAQGCLKLKAGQRAVFNNALNLVAEEIDVPIMWESSTERSEETVSDTDTRVTNLFTNDLNPLVYLHKELGGYAVLPDDAEFTFTVEYSTDGEDWTALGDEPYWVVKEDFAGTALIPTVLSSGVTDSDGQLTMSAGDIIAISPGHSGIKYRIRELASSDWLAESDIVTGTLDPLGNSETFINYYKYKNLLLDKNIIGQNAEDCSQVFEFTLYEVGEDDALTPVTDDYTWYLQSDPDVTGELDDGV
ncbi:MAG: hypothetical protein HUJ65_05785, partial [Oscillospiraceae bacterium]|nr:hypothetical protein [Oscillospiraceae bacterium]